MIDGNSLIAWIHWDPPREFVVIPYLNFPLTWYGLLFAVGFWLGLSIFILMYKRHLAGISEFTEESVNFDEMRKGFFAYIKRGDLESCNVLLKRPLADPLFSIKLRRGDLNLVKWVRQNYGKERGDLLEKRFALEYKFPKAFLPLYLRAKLFSESLLLYVLIATVLGARLGHVFFYENPLEYLKNPLLILKTWEGGLASHGAIVAILFAGALFYRKHKKSSGLSLYGLLDHLAVPAMFIGVMIRIGNFLNQEILGVPSLKPWAIVFMHPIDGGAVVPRHPAQLYEALFYFLLFLTTAFLWRFRGGSLLPGRIAGVAILGSFLFRFLIEFIKSGQSAWFDGSHLFLMGQVLSFPLIAIGSYLLFRKKSSDVVFVKGE